MTAWFPRGGNKEAKPLTVIEWGRFARWLNSKKLTPGRLMEKSVANLLKDWQDKSITVERLESLLARGMALALSWEKWERAGLWVMTRSDLDYPSGLKCRLKQNSPAVLFGCGNKALLNENALAVVGSRNVKGEALAYSTLLGGMATRHNYSVVSGGADGVDQAAMFGALLSGGKAVGVLADSLMSTCLSEKYRDHLMDDRLALISPYNPEAGFNAGNAMQRNKYIYCLSSAAFVVHSHKEKGGTWNGALENLKEQWVPLWIREDSNPTGGNANLKKRGAKSMPRQINKLDFSGLFVESYKQEPKTDSYETFLEKIHVACGDAPRKPAELSEQMQISKTQLSAWLKRAADENRIEKINKPVRYRWIDPELANYSLFLKRIRSICGDRPLKSAELGEQIPIRKNQLNSWLKQAVSEGKIEKLDKPVRYRWVDTRFADYEIFLKKIQTLCSDVPCKTSELSEQIPISKNQLNILLQRAVSENKIRKLKSPVRYLYSIQGALSLGSRNRASENNISTSNT